MKKQFTAAHWGSYEATRQDGRASLRPIEGDANPSLIGRGWLDAMQDPKTRIARPVVRKGWLERRDTQERGEDAFVEVSWDEALDLAAGEVARVGETHGNQAIFAGSYGWASAGRFHHAQSHLRRFLNTVGGFTGARDTYSHAAAEVLLPHLTGMSNRRFQDAMTSWSHIAQHTELLVAFGGVSGRTAQVSASGTSTHEVETWFSQAVANGMAVVNVSPQASDVMAPTAEWLALRPNTDTALMLGLAHAIHANGQHDQDFLDRHTSGWQTFVDYLTGVTDGIAKSPEWAARICDVDATEIRSLADRMVRQRTKITLTWGVQRADHGEQPIWMGLTLAAMLGEIGQPGTGFGFGYGSVTPVGRPTRDIRWPSLPQGNNPVDEIIPVARIADMLLRPGEEYTYNGATHRFPDARLVWWAGGNPFHHHQDLFRLEQAWKRPETVIVNEHSWTATARRADIVFPVTSSLERADIMANRRDPMLLFMEPVIEPYGDARTDYAVFTGLAERLGTEAAFTEGRDAEAWLRELWGKSRLTASDAGMDLPDFDTFRAAGMFVCPDMDAEITQFGDFVDHPEANPLATESGGITIANQKIAAFRLPDCPGHPSWIEPAEWLGAADDDQLHLVSGQPGPRLHGQLDPGPVSRKTKIQDREPCTLHPATAARNGIAEGDIVLIENHRGACLAGAVLSDGIREDCIALATGAWFDPQVTDGRRLDVHGNPNVLTIDRGCSGLSQGTMAHTALVRISRWTGPLPPISVFEPPAVVPRQTVAGSNY
ncbi:MAG: molybdopterin-dependent oxidoreductase [Hyphomicrobiales bacterium]|nr:molybdopterin-dependent oxidoreductase [Hyphomicrobiales bacterium]